MATKKLTLWILAILVLVVAFLLGYQSGLKGGLNVGYRQAYNDSIISRLFGGRRAAAPTAQAPSGEQVAAQAAATTVTQVKNPYQAVKEKADLTSEFNPFQ